ncbi:MAG: tellurite resistance TerB family protein [Cocleimonas sp.]
MDTKSFLDELLKTGKDLAGKGQAIAEEKLNMPTEGAERDAKMDGIKKGAMAAGVLALLLGTKGGRALSGSALKIGSLAAIGGIGYKAYQNWTAEKNATEQEYKDMAEDIGKDNASNGTLVNFDKLDDKETENRSQILLKAMIAAAKADGHVNSKEVAAIEEQITKLGLGDDTAALIQDEIAKPLDVKEVAALANDQAMAAEIYLVSAVIANRENSMERDYLANLAEEMGLPAGLVAQLQDVKEEDLA